MSEIKMPERVKKIHSALTHEILELSLHFKILKQIIEVDEEQLGLMKEFASAFFRVVQDSLIDGIILKTARLLDPVQTGRKQNFVLEQLVGELDKHEAGLADKIKLRQKIAEAKAFCGWWPKSIEKTQDSRITGFSDWRLRTSRDYRRG